MSQEINGASLLGDRQQITRREMYQQLEKQGKSPSFYGHKIEKFQAIRAKGGVLLASSFVTAVIFGVTCTFAMASTGKIHLLPTITLIGMVGAQALGALVPFCIAAYLKNKTLNEKLDITQLNEEIGTIHQNQKRRNEQLSQKI